MQDKLDFIKDLLKSCSTPSLKQDFDNVAVSAEHFAEYHKALEVQLPVLYDFVQQHEEWLKSSGQDESINGVRASLVLLLCEMTARTCPIYQFDNAGLIKHANTLLERQQLEPTIEKIIFKYYQENLHKDCWKRQLGSVHGFLRFLEFRFGNGSTRDRTRDMNRQWLDFCLSVGLTVRESSEPSCKHIGVRVFRIMLQRGNFSDIQDRNIHAVIYDSVYKDVHFMDSVNATTDIWNCLYDCLDFIGDLDSFNWCCVDDMLEVLLRNITLAPSTDISICLLRFVTKLGAYFAINREEIESTFKADLSIPTNLEACRTTCALNTSYTIFKWAKSLLNIFVVDAYKLMQRVEVCQQLLQELHRCYMVYIMPISLPVLLAHLPTFYEKFTAALMETVNIQQRDPSVVQLVKCFLETFHLQLANEPFCDSNKKLQEFRSAFERLLQHEPFN